MRIIVYIAVKVCYWRDKTGTASLASVRCQTGAGQQDLVDCGHKVKDAEGVPVLRGDCLIEGRTQRRHSRGQQAALHRTQPACHLPVTKSNDT